MLEIFATLGINQTLFIQFGIFLVVYMVLSNVLFKPYLTAYAKRKEQTVGKTDLAERFIQETKQLEVEYSTKARELNQKTKEIFDASRSEALKQHDQVVSEARGKAKEILDSARGKINQQTESARKELLSQVPEITSTINSQVIGKELVQ